MRPRSDPIASVVMAVWNGEVYLDQAVRSILEQTFSEFEFIVVDDGSSDRSSDMLAAYAERDPRISIFRCDNRGTAGALNYACEQASGKYLLNLDQDDLAFHTRIESQIAFMEQNPATVLLGTASQMVWADGRVITDITPPTEDESIRQQLTYHATMCHSSIAMRREAFMAVGGYRAPFLCAVDYDLYSRLAEMGKLANLDEILVQYRIHGDQQSAFRFEQTVLGALAVQVACKLRAKKESEEGLLKDPLSRETLKQFGVADEEMDRSILVVLERHLMLALSPERPAESDQFADAFIGNAKQFCDRLGQKSLRLEEFPTISKVLNLGAVSR